MKFKTYVAIAEVGKIKYVTSLAPGNKALWEEDKPAKAMTETLAKDIVYGLCANGYPAIVVKALDWRAPHN